MPPEAHLPWARERVRGFLAGGGERLVALAIASLDFLASVDGRTRGLSSDADMALMYAWREAADVLLVGSRTLAIERYGSLTPELPYPPIATISRDGRLDVERSLRANPPPRLAVYGATRPDSDRVEWRESPADIEAVVADLHARGARTIVCEGGPILFGLLFRAGLVTDYSLTVSPVMAGVGVPVIGYSDDGEPGSLVLADETAVGDHVFLQYARKSTTR